MNICFLYTQLLTKVDSWRDSANTEQAQLALAAPEISDTLKGMREISFKHASESKIQEERFKTFKGIHCNAMMTERMLHQFADLDAQSLDMLRMAMERLKLSARAYNRILKVSRTIADLEGSDKVMSHHIAEAIGYRNLDRSDWAERGL